MDRSLNRERSLSLEHGRKETREDGRSEAAAATDVGGGCTGESRIFTESDARGEVIGVELTSKRRLKMATALDGRWQFARNKPDHLQPLGESELSYATTDQLQKTGRYQVRSD